MGTSQDSKLAGPWLLCRARSWCPSSSTFSCKQAPKVTVMGSTEVQWSDFVGLALWLIGFGLEASADLQKYLFKQNPANKGRYIDTGARCHTTSSACVKQAARLLDA